MNALELFAGIGGTAGKRRGTGDERWLWPEFARVVRALRPRFVIGENVMGHRTSGLRFVLRDLDQLGYTTRAGIVSAEEVGAPHRRQRIFILAEAADPNGGGLAQHPERDGQSDTRLEAPRGHDAVGLRPDVADPPRPRRGRGGSEGSDWVQGKARSDQRTEPPGGGWWAAEPDVGRVAHGVPGRVDRLRALGNAVVPQVAEYVARLLLSGAWADV